MDNKNEIFEIIFIGRGGQGIVTASQLTGESLFLNGFNDVKVIPSYGAERRGALVEAYLRFSHSDIYKLSPVETADYLVYFDDTLFDEDYAIKRVKKDYIIILNTDKNFICRNLDNSKIFKINVTDISLKNNLTVQSLPIVNTPMIGAFSAITNLFSLDQLKQTIKKYFNEKDAVKNIRTIEEVYNLYKSKN